MSTSDKEPQARFLGIDLGTSSLKLAAYSAALSEVALVRREYSTQYTPDGGAEQNAEHWWRAVCEGLAELNARCSLQHIEAIGFSGFNAVVGVTANGDPCGPAITYLDRRSSGVYREMAGRIESETVFRLSANRFASSGMWAPTLCWLRRSMPSYWKQSDLFLSPSGFLLGRLCGQPAVDGSRASLTLLHDPTARTLEWQPELCRLFEIDREKLPPIVDSWEVVGRLDRSPELPAELRPGVPLIAGGIDSCCAALANAVADNTVLFDIGGSAGGLAGVDSVPHPDPRLLTVRYLTPGHWAAIGPLSAAGSAWQWFRDRLLGERFDDEELISRAEACQPGAAGLFLMPYLAGSRSPQWDETVRAQFAGVTLQHSTGHFARAVLEGVTYAQRDLLAAFAENGFAPAEVRVAGGQVSNRFWLQLKADVLDLPHRCLSLEESSVFGAALLAAGAAGGVNLLSENPRVRAADSFSCTPRPQLTQAYQRAYRDWCRVRADLLA